MVLFIICVMIILNPKQFRGSSVSDLQNCTRYLHDGIGAVLGHGCFSIFYICHTLLRRATVLSICCFWYLSSHFKMSL